MVTRTTKIPGRKPSKIWPCRGIFSKEKMEQNGGDISPEELNVDFSEILIAFITKQNIEYELNSSRSLSQIKATKNCIQRDVNSKRPDHKVTRLIWIGRPRSQVDTLDLDWTAVLLCMSCT